MESLQNNKNFVESMLGEAVQMRDLGLPYAFCYLIPERALYLTKTSSFDHIDRFTQDDLKVYHDICTDEAYKDGCCGGNSDYTLQSIEYLTIENNRKIYFLKM